jgi:hypothetical protein
LSLLCREPNLVGLSDLQACYMGFPATMGAAFMPWLITDSVS